MHLKRREKLSSIKFDFVAIDKYLVMYSGIQYKHTDIDTYIQTV